MLRQALLLLVISSCAQQWVSDPHRFLPSGPSHLSFRFRRATAGNKEGQFLRRCLLSVTEGYKNFPSE